MLWNTKCVKIILIYWIHFVNAVPPDYCLQTLNTSNCKRPPTPVFYYYKPGSRCELGVWRGCPTYNKFDDEYHCSHYCIFRFIKQDAVPDNVIDYTNQCSKTITENICKGTKRKVAYTFDNDHQDCVPIVWGDCKSPNIFKQKQTCIDTCVTDWHDEIKNLTDDEVKEIDKLLHEVTANATTRRNKHLKLADDDETTSPIPPTTFAPKTVVPTTAIPAIVVPTTAIPTTVVPTTAIPTTVVPTTAIPATVLPTTAIPITIVPTTVVPTTVSENLVPKVKNSTEVPAAPSTETTTNEVKTTTIRIRGTAKEVVLPDDLRKS